MSIDSLHYKVDTNSQNDNESTTWIRLDGKNFNAGQTYNFFTPVTHVNSEFDAELTVRLFASNGTMTEATTIARLGNSADITSPLHHGLNAVYYGYYHPERPNNLDLLIGSIEDPESRIASLAYRILDNNANSGTLVDWKEMLQRPIMAFLCLL